MECRYTNVERPSDKTTASLGASQLQHDELSKHLEGAGAAQPSVFTAQPSVFAAQPSVFAAQPSVFTAQPSVCAAQPSVFTAQPSVFTAQPSVFTAQPSFFAAHGCIQLEAALQGCGALPGPSIVHGTALSRPPCPCASS
eukprot:1160951-Pelagomonas_calceolata.AAC.10